MDDLHGFGDPEVYTLVVGDGKQILTVPKAILTRIPFFEKALSSSSFEESSTKTFTLPDDDPQAIADVIYCTYGGDINLIAKNHQEFAAEEREMLTARYLRAYVAADKLLAEETQNKLSDIIIQSLAHMRVTNTFLTILSRSGLRETPLYKLMVAELAVEAMCGTSTVVSWCDDLEKRELSDLVKALVTCRGSRGFPSAKAVQNLCELHKHVITEKCRKTGEAEHEDGEEEEDDDVANLDSDYSTDPETSNMRL